MRLYFGLGGVPGIAIFSVRTQEGSKIHLARTEFIEGVTEHDAVTRAKRVVDALEADKSVVRIVVAPVSSERRREAQEVFGKATILPFNRVNGKHP
jgi:hypothetical protein